LDEEGEEILIHDEARIEYAEERNEATQDNENLEEKDNNAIILARNNMRMTVDPRMRLSEPSGCPHCPKLTKGNQCSLM
jgi:hypothetical protein